MASLASYWIMDNTLELRPEDFPVNIRLKYQDGTKEYVLVKTKQNRRASAERADPFNSVG